MQRSRAGGRSGASGELVVGHHLEAVATAVGATIDPAFVRQLLVFGGVPTPYTIYGSAVMALGPGERLTWRAGRVDLERSEWPLVPPPDGDGEALVALAGLLADALDSLGTSPPPVLLDGTPASGVLAALLNELGRASGVALRFSDDPPDPVGATLGIPVESVVVTDEQAPAILDRVLEAPRPDARPEQVVKAALDVAWGGSALVSAAGARSLFFDYPTFLMDPVARTIDRFGLGRQSRWLGRLGALMPSLPAAVPPELRAERFSAGLGFSGPERHMVWMAASVPEQHHQLLSASVLAGLAGGEGAARPGPLEPVVREWEQPLDDELSGIGHLYFRLFTLDVAAARLPGPAPFCTPEVVGFARGLSTDQKVRGLSTGFIVRELARRLGVPAVLPRVAQPPLGRWLRGPLRDRLLSDLSRDRLVDMGLLDPVGVGALIRDHLSGRADHGPALWALLVLQRWLSPS